MDPLISVIVPVYKVEPYLRRCLDSICNQSYRNLEIICVNDGSPDNSLAILEEYAARDSRITIINQENQGLGAARNTGIDAAHGEWVSGVDSDDWIEPNLYAKAVACMKEDIDIICYGAFVDGEVNSQKAADMQKYYDIDSAGETVMKTFQQLQRVSVNFWSKLYRCSLLKKYRLRQPARKRYEDVAFFYSVMLVSRKVAFINARLYHYIQRNDSIMGQSFARDARGLELLDELIFFYHFLKDHELLRKYRELMLNVIEYHYRQVHHYIPESLYPAAADKTNAIAELCGFDELPYCSWKQDARVMKRGKMYRYFHDCLNGEEKIGLGKYRPITIRNIPCGKILYINGKRIGRIWKYGPV